MTVQLRRSLAAVAAALIVHVAPSELRAQVNPKTWADVMYLGGAAGVRGKSLEWDNKLTISRDAITFSGKNKIRFDIVVSSIRRLEYTGHGHTNDGAAAAGLVAAGLIGALAGSAFRSTDHYLLVEYSLSDDRAGAVLFRLHKKNQQEIIDAAHEATGIPRAR